MLARRRSVVFFCVVLFTCSSVRASVVVAPSASKPPLLHAITPLSRPFFFSSSPRRVFCLARIDSVSQPTCPATRHIGDLSTYVCSGYHTPACPPEKGSITLTHLSVACAEVDKPTRLLSLPRRRDPPPVIAFSFIARFSPSHLTSPFAPPPSPCSLLIPTVRHNASSGVLSWLLRQLSPPLSLLAAEAVITRGGPRGGALSCPARSCRLGSNSSLSASLRIKKANSKEGTRGRLQSVDSHVLSLLPSDSCHTAARLLPFDFVPPRAHSVQTLFLLLHRKCAQRLVW